MLRGSLHAYRLPLRTGILLKGIWHEERPGCLLRIEDAEGRVGWGDCAPLPGFSRESLEEAVAQLDEIAPWIAGRRTDPDWADPAHPIHREIDDLRLHPSPRFALELALLDLTAQSAGKPLPSLLHPNPADTLPINALLSGDDETALLEEAATRVSEGYRTLKLKVGRGDVARDIEIVRRLRSRLGPEVAIRCDANQAWAYAEAVAFAEGVLGLDLEYVEEPLAEPDRLGALWLDTQLPMALDESLAGLEPADLESRAYIKAVVLKPTVLGGMLRTLQFAEEAIRLDMRVIISGAFESGIAMRAHVALATVTGGLPAGLDPYTRLTRDVLRPRLPLDRPNVEVSDLFQAEHEIMLPSE